MPGQGVWCPLWQLKLRRLRTDSAPRLDLAPSSLAGFETAVLALLRNGGWGGAGEDYGAQDLAQAAEVGSWRRRTAELAQVGAGGWPGFPCKPVVVHQARAGTKYLTTHPVLQAAWCSALLRSRAGGPVLNRPLTNLCAPFHSLFLFPVLLLPEQISTSSSPSLSLLLHPQPVVSSPSPSLPTSPRGLPFSD